MNSIRNLYNEASLEYDALVRDKMGLLRQSRDCAEVSEILDIHTRYMRILADLLRPSFTHELL